jgi:hypothetical protein
MWPVSDANNDNFLIGKLFCEVKTYKWSSLTFFASSFSAFYSQAISVASAARQLFQPVLYGPNSSLHQKQRQDSDAFVSATFTARIAVLKVRFPLTYIHTTMKQNCILNSSKFSFISQYFNVTVGCLSCCDIVKFAKNYFFFPALAGYCGVI